MRPLRIISDQFVANLLPAVNIRNIRPRHNRNPRIRESSANGTQRRQRHNRIARQFRFLLQRLNFPLRIEMVVAESFSPNYLQAPAFQIAPECLGIADSAKSKYWIGTKLPERFGVSAAMPAKTEQLRRGRVDCELRKFLDGTDG